VSQDNRGDLDIVKAGLLERIESVCGELLPGGRVEGGQWVAFNPVEHDAKPGRQPALKVRVRGGDLGAWRCWRSGAAGDVVGLVAYCLTGDRRDVKRALAWGRDFLGLKRLSPQERAGLRRKEAERKRDADRKADRWRRHRLQSAAELFMARPGSRDVGPAAVPQGTFAFGSGHPAERHGLAYLAARGVDLAGLAFANRESFRFSPATEWWRGADWRVESGPHGQRRVKAAPGPLFPAIHSAMRNALGHVTACHVTFLDPVEPVKAPVAKAKLIWGEAKGAVVEISTGPSGEPFWQADALGLAPDPLIIGEGIETAGSFCEPVPEARCWAAGSLPGVTHAPAGLGCVEWILFARDNNTGNAQAQKQFETALAGLESHGKRVVVEASHVGDDFNDLARGVE
jgi:hypothetical protein